MYLNVGMDITKLSSKLFEEILKIEVRVKKISKIFIYRAEIWDFKCRGECIVRIMLLV